MAVDYGAFTEFRGGPELGVSGPEATCLREVADVMSTADGPVPARLRRSTHGPSLLQRHFNHDISDIRGIQINSLPDIYFPAN
jgi:hypothetical protein